MKHIKTVALLAVVATWSVGGNVVGMDTPSVLSDSEARTHVVAPVAIRPFDGCIWCSKIRFSCADMFPDEHESIFAINDREKLRDFVCGKLQKDLRNEELRTLNAFFASHGSDEQGNLLFYGCHECYNIVYKYLVASPYVLFPSRTALKIFLFKQVPSTDSEIEILNHERMHLISHGY